MFFDLNKKKDKLHLLPSVCVKILLDIDKAIKIIRETEEDANVIPEPDGRLRHRQIQAEFIADIRLRNINREYILKRTQETEALENEIKKLEEIVKSRRRSAISSSRSWSRSSSNYPSERRTRIITADNVQQFDEEDHIEDYPVLLFLTREGYFKKIMPQSWRMSQDHKLKEGDEVFWTPRGRPTERNYLFHQYAAGVQGAPVPILRDSKASVLGDYLASKLEMDEGETPVYAVPPGDYKGSMVVVFKNGKAARFSMESFETKDQLDAA